MTDSEVVPHARRRQFSNADKRRILDAADRCTRPCAIGALMRREGMLLGQKSFRQLLPSAQDLERAFARGDEPLALVVDQQYQMHSAGLSDRRDASMPPP